MADAIRPAATVILWRAGPDGFEVLMGQRGSAAAFMPSKVVFPGGAVDPADAQVDLARPLAAGTEARLAMDADGVAPRTLAAAAIRELWEETGLALAVPAAWTPPPDAGPDWPRLAAAGYGPAADSLRFVFRAVTPPGRHARRYDARFLMAPATALAPVQGVPSGELSGLAWITLTAARQLDLPFATAVAVAEAAALLDGGEQAAGVPFFDNRGDRPVFRRLG